MKLTLNTFYKNQDQEGNSIACLECTLETANTDLRNKVLQAIKSALAGPAPAVEEKQSAMGFQLQGPEDEE